MSCSLKKSFVIAPSSLKAARRGRSNSGGVLCQATAPDQGLTMPITPLSEISSSVPSTAPAPPVVLISSLVAHVGDTGSWSLPAAPSDGDWRDFRAQLVTRSRTTPQATWDEVDDAVYGPSDAGKESGDWAHLIAQPEIGCVLLANPLLFHNSQTYFDKAVILVIDSSEQGSMGIILNKPSELRLKNMEDVVLENRFRIFAQNKVYLGGDVDGDGLYLLHEHDVPGAQQVRPGLFLGGAEGLCDGVNKNEILPESVRWFCRYAGWAKGQLADECARNVWYPVSCSTSLLLPRIPKNQKHSPDMWHDIMELIGDDFRRVSRTIRADEYRPRMN